MIDAAILKTVRKARKLGRPRLAKMTKLTERQIARLEGAGAGHHAAPDGAAPRIATALQVPVEVLAGDMPLKDADLVPASQCTKGCCG